MTRDWRPLLPHPDRRPSVSFELAASMLMNGAACHLVYRLSGPIAQVALPAAAPSARRDDLWRHTCFELFARDEGPGYLEFNFAPSTEWAAYRFDDYRTGMAPLDVAPPDIEVARAGDDLTLSATIQLPARPRTLALTAVIEETNGRLSYWSLAHPDGPPDFHHARCFALELPPAD
jgi:hypothetical protein